MRSAWLAMNREQLDSIVEWASNIAPSQLFETLRQIDSEMNQIRIVNRWNDRDFEIFELLAYKRIELIAQIKKSKEKIKKTK